MSITQLVSTIHLKDSITLTLNSEFLNHNFDVVKQCLLRIKDLENHMGKSKENTSNIEAKIKQMEEKIHNNAQNIHTNQQKIKELNANVGDQFMKKMYGIEAKTKNMFDFDQTVRKLSELNKFVIMDQFNEQKQETQRQLQHVWKLKQDFNRYLLNSNFDKYKLEQEHQLSEKQRLIDQCNEQVRGLAAEIGKLRQGVQKVEQNVQQNNNMIKQINFPQLLDKLKKFRDQTEGKVNQLTAKMKKKVSQNELMALQKSMIDKLDKFLAENERNKAEKQETKEALLFLEKKINDIEDIVIQKTSEQDKDALFSSKKWQCASCTKDLGKYEGKMGQYKPWSIFPCKELDPEKSGGFGYLNYIDKMAYKKGFDIQEPSLERLNKTFYQTTGKEREMTSKKLGTTRGSNLITNYGSEQKGSSLKDVYFKELQSERGASTNRIFRVTKKEIAKPMQQEIKEIQEA